MIKYSQVPSPVISPRISTGNDLFSQARAQIGNRLEHAVSVPDRVPRLIAAGQASISNPLVASVSEYSPQPGNRLARQMHLDVQNTPGSKVDNVVDAIQRYLDIRPRREPTADPLDEASVARHPQQLNQPAARWAKARYYQFEANGLERYQFQPKFRAWGGRLELNIANQGQADISAPAHRSPLSGAGGLPSRAAEPEAFAPSEAFRTAVARAKEGFEKIVSPPVKVGAPNQSEDILASPNKAWSTSTVIDKALEGENYRDEDKERLAKPYRSRGLDEACLRVIRIMRELEVGVLKPLTGVLDGRA